MIKDRKHLLDKISEQGLNPDSLSKKTNLSIIRLSKFIMGEDNLTNSELLLLASAMKVTRPWLITGENGPAPKRGSKPAAKPAAKKAAPKKAAAKNTAGSGWTATSKDKQVEDTTSKKECIFDKYEKIGLDAFYRYENNFIAIDKISSIQLTSTGRYTISVIGRPVNIKINEADVIKMLDKIIEYNDSKPKKIKIKSW